MAIRNSQIEEHRNNPLRHYLIKASSGEDTHRTKINFESLDFIFETEKPDFLNQLSMFELEANSTIDFINERSKLHFNHIQPSIEKVTSNINAEISVELIDESVGMLNKDIILKMTDDMIDHIDNIIEITPKHIKMLNEILKIRFQGYQILRMDIPNKKKI